LVAVPMFCPMMSAQAWSSPTAPAKCADSVTAMAAVDDCITAVIARPITINASTPNKLDHQLTPGPKMAGRSAGGSRSATQPLPQCRQSKKQKGKSSKRSTCRRHASTAQQLDQSADKDHR